MRVVELRDGFGLDRLRVTERPDPGPGAGRIVVRVRAASLNYRDLLMVEGRYDPRQPLPLVPCSDGAGEVAAVGAGVTRVAPGDRVIPIFAQRWIAGAPTRERLRSTLGGPLDGTLAELVELDAEGVVAAPGHLSDEEAATLPCAGLTAWNALQAGTPVGAGETVLVLGTGGVATFALQLAAAAGARVIVTSSRDDKLERARLLGASETINYRAIPQWGRRVRELTGGEGVDRVIDIGGADTLAQSLAAVAFGGQVVVVGNVTGGTVELNVVPVFMRQVRIQGMLVGHRDSFERMNRAIAAAGLRPVIDRTFPLEEHRAAFERLRSGDHVGKVCLRV